MTATDGTGKVTAAVESMNGEMLGNYVYWKVRWNVAGDCTGAMELDGTKGMSTYWFMVSGNPKEPVIDGVMIDHADQTGAVQMKKIKF